MVRIILTIFLLSPTVSGQSWPKFLGPADPTVRIVTPKYRITVNTGGFDHPRPKRTEKKLPGRMRKQGVGENMIRHAQEYARGITGSVEPSTMPGLIDGAVDWIKARWETCGGRHAQFARGFNWSRVTVTVRDTIFPNPDTGVMSSAVAYSPTSVHVVNLSFQAWFSDPENAAIIDISGGARWEFGNILAWSMDGSPRDIGTAAPCQ